VVVVAELFLAETWASAAASVGEDVAALVLLWRFVCVVHVPLPTGYFFVQSIRKTGDKSGLPARALRLNAKARLLAGPLFLAISILTNEA
jgi:hypothetical protein